MIATIIAHTGFTYAFENSRKERGQLSIFFLTR